MTKWGDTRDSQTRLCHKARTVNEVPKLYDVCCWACGENKHETLSLLGATCTNKETGSSVTFIKDKDYCPSCGKETTHYVIPTIRSRWYFNDGTILEPRPNVGDPW